MLLLSIEEEISDLGADMMKNTKLGELNLTELMELRQDVDLAIASAEAEARRTALEDVQKTAQEHGFSIEELIGKGRKPPSSPSKSPPKFRNPGNPKETWSGRGRQPNWFKSAVDRGISEADMKI